MLHFLERTILCYVPFAIHGDSWTWNVSKVMGDSILYFKMKCSIVINLKKKRKRAKNSVILSALLWFCLRVLIQFLVLSHNHLYNHSLCDLFTNSFSPDNPICPGGSSCWLRFLFYGHDTNIPEGEKLVQCKSKIWQNWQAGHFWSETFQKIQDVD